MEMVAPVVFISASGRRNGVLSRPSIRPSVHILLSGTVLRHKYVGRLIGCGLRLIRVHADRRAVMDVYLGVASLFPTIFHAIKSEGNRL